MSDEDIERQKEESAKMVAYRLRDLRCMDCGHFERPDVCHKDRDIGVEHGIYPHWEACKEFIE